MYGFIVYVTRWNLVKSDNRDGLITHLQPDILECKVKRALGSITMKKASGGDGIPVDLVQILKDDAMKMMHSICQKIWETQQWPQDWKSQFSFQSQRKAMPKNAQTTAQLHSSHMPAKYCSKFQKNIYFCFIDYIKAFDCVDHHKLQNSSRDGNTRPPDLPPEKSVCRLRSNS